MKKNPVRVSLDAPRAPAELPGFLLEMRIKAARAGLKWDVVPLDSGKIPRSADWDLRKLKRSTETHAAHINSFATIDDYRQAAAAKGLPPLWSLDIVLPAETREFIKAYAVWRSKKIKRARSIGRELTVLRGLFTVVNKPPWRLTSSDLARFASLELKHTYRTLSALCKLLNERLLTVAVPIEAPAVVKGQHGAVGLPSGLNDRIDGHKLPDAEALYELMRIVSQETPKGHTDRLRFGMV